MIIKILFLIGFLLINCVAPAQWRQTNVPPSHDTYSFAVKDSIFYAGTDEGIVLHTTNNGISWNSASVVGYPMDLEITSLSALGSNIFATTFTGDLYVSSDSGASWKAARRDFANTPINVSITYGKYLLLGHNFGGIFISFDTAASWTKISPPSLDSTIVYSIIISGPNIIAGTNGSGIFCSTDFGTTWTKSTELDRHSFLSFASSGADLFAGSVDSGVFRSTDNGVSWKKTGFNKSIVHSLITYGTNLFAGSDEGVSLSTDNGNHWTIFNDGFTLPNRIFSFAIFNNDLFAASDNGVWRRPLSEMIPSAVNSSNQPSTFHLSQNYPNPFTESTTLSFDLPERAFISLKVYDITGREVAVLANESLDAGSYSRMFNAESLPSGTYLCHFEAGGFREERTLFLLR